MTIEEFIAARIAEREEAANEAIAYERDYREHGYELEYQWVRFSRRSRESGASSLFLPGAPSPAELLRDIAAKRMALEEFQLFTGWRGAPIQGWVALRDGVIKPMAAIWSDHPDYQQDWAK